MAPAIKTISTFGKTFEIEGLSETDPYFGCIGDDFESGFAAFCAKYLKPDARCLDIGANIGVTSLILASTCPNGRIVSIEAGKTVFELLRKNLAANGVDNVTPINVAAGEKEGTALFEEYSAYGTVSEKGIPTEMLSAPALFERSGLDRLDFMKIDIEGMEHEFMRGAYPLLQRLQPIVHIEFNPLALMCNGMTNPYALAKDLFVNFPYVYLTNGSELEDIGKAGALSFMHGISERRSQWDDLVLAFQPLLN